MKTTYLIFGFFLMALVSNAQGKYLTKQGYVSFFSSTMIEDIKADNNQVLSVIDTKDGSVAIAILMKSFMFEKSLMQEHFNENFVESDKYPKAIFRGKIEDYSPINSGAKEVYIIGKITIHGVTKDIEIAATLAEWKGNLMIKGVFPLLVSDFDIHIPTVVSNNIAKTVEVSFESIYKPYLK
ncbi:YceI family protein [Wenyingzhuangia sp. IMCC45533]